MRPKIPLLGWIMLALMGFWVPSWALGQSSTSMLVERCQRAHSRAEMQRSLRDLWLQDSTQTYLVADAVRDHYESVGAALSRPQADTLLRMYGIGIRFDEGGTARWLISRALLGQSNVNFYPRQSRKWAMEAIESAAADAPSMLYMQAGQALVREYKAMQLSLNAAAHDWAILDRAFLLRQVTGGSEASQWAQIHEHLTLEIRSALPDCNQLFSSFSEAIGMNKLTAEACESFLVVYSLQGCDRPALWESALQTALQAGGNAWLYRLAGTEAFNRGQIALSRAHWQKACSLETSVALQANDQLEIAATYRAEKDFRMARSMLQDAMRKMPDWGEPYLHLIDLYQVGSESCKMSEFERKALNWLLMDLCQKLKSVDESYAAEADLRYYSFLQSAPSATEAAFQGWKPGDTYPFKCWMSTVTTVPQQ